MFSAPLFQSRGYGKKTASAGTAIVQLVEPVRNAFTRLLSLAYTNAGTAHTLTVMRPLAKTTLTAAAAGGQAVVAVAADPGDYAGVRTSDNPIAASDYVVLELADGTFLVDTVASVSSLNVTLANSLPTLGAASGATLWFFGVVGDVNPNDAMAHPQYALTASAVTKLGNDVGHGIAGFVGSFTGPVLDGRYNPLLVHSNNATAAGVLEYTVAAHTSK